VEYDRTRGKGIFAIAALGVLLLSGCATTGQVMQRAPSVTLTSSATPQQVVNCYAPKALANWGQSKVIPNGDGQTIVVSASAFGDPIAVASVMPSGSATSIAVRRGNMVSDHVFDSIVSTLRGCAAS